ncbi:MAG: PilZ domain-containing protein [Nitrospira sp.]|nr:PilZ domain-containing protein [Nitrospira sp.]
MQTTHQDRSNLNTFRRHPRVRVSTPFSCTFTRSESSIRGWLRVPDEGVGVVYDLSLHGVRVSTEAEMKPGDVVGLTLQLPKQIAPARITAATVRWTRGQSYGLAFRKISQASLSRLTKFMKLTTRGKD